MSALRTLHGGSIQPFVLRSVPWNNRTPPALATDWTPDKIRALRKRLKMTQAEFASALGFSRRGSVTELESGEFEPSGSTAELLRHLDAHGPLPAKED